MDKFDTIKERANALKGAISQGRQALFTEQEQVFFFDWQERANVEKQMDNVKLTLSPDGRNALMGALRLLIATDPVFSVPTETSDEDARAVADPMEKFAAQMWDAAGKTTGQPIHYDAVLSALLYAETNIAVKNMDKLLEMTENGSPAEKARMQDIARRTPYLYDVWNPKQCYPEYDSFGLTGHLRETLTTNKRVKDDFMAAAKHLPNNYQSCTLREWWDLTHHTVWVEGDKRQIIHEEHKLPFIPIVVINTEGSTRLFAKTEQQLQPFLYTLVKSGMWNRQNLALTVLYTIAFAIGSNPMFLYKANQPGKELNLNFDRPGGLITIDRDEDFGPLLRQVIDPAVLKALEIADEKATDSTIYRQALGEPLTGNAPFSLVALLSQAGRLPLVSPQRRLGWAIARAMETSFKWMKAGSLEVRRAGSAYKAIEIDPKEIPDDFEFDVTLDVTLPQDQLQAANVANALTQGDNPLVSLEWVREKILKIGQSGEMTAQIWRERAGTALFASFIQDMLGRLAQLQKPPQEVGGGGKPPQGEIPPGGEAPPGPPPQELPGNPPMQGGLPAVMGQNGGQLPMQPGGMRNATPG